MSRKLLAILPLILAADAARAGFGTFANGKVITNLAAGTQTSDEQGGTSQSSAAIDILADETFSFSGVSGHGISHLKVLTEMGRIHAFGEGFATSTRIVGHDGGYTRFSANDNHPGYEVGSWYDLIHVTSPTLAAGTPVRLQLTSTLEGTKSAFAPYPNNGTHAYLRTAFGSEFSLIVMQDGILSSSKDIFVDTYVGDMLNLGSSMEIQGETSITDSGPSTCRVDAFNTGLVTLASLTPGATFTSDSGYAYGAAPVPEPATFAALALGAAALLRRRRRA